MNNQVARLRSAEPDVVVLAGIPKPVALFLRAAETQGWAPTWVGPSLLADPLFAELGGSAVEGMHIVFDVALPNMPEAQATNKILAKNAPDTRPGYFAYNGVIGAMLFVEALKHIEGEPTREALIEAMESIKGFESGIFPPITYTKGEHQIVWGLDSLRSAIRVRLGSPNMLKPDMPSSSSSLPTSTGSVLQLKIRLLGLSPMVWRRVLVPETYSLRELHGVIQVTMGWESLHLFEFRIGSPTSMTWATGGSTRYVSKAGRRPRNAGGIRPASAALAPVHLRIAAGPTGISSGVMTRLASTPWMISRPWRSLLSRLFSMATAPCSMTKIRAMQSSARSTGRALASRLSPAGFRGGTSTRAFTRMSTGG
jgi:hypothetical protein